MKNTITRRRIPLVIAAALIVAMSYFNQNCFFKTQSIKAIDSYAQIADVLNNADKNTLVVFDVDDTLIVSPTTQFRTTNIEKNSDWLRQVLKPAMKKTDKSKGYLMSIRKAQETPVLIEPNIPQMISSLQARGVKVLALTAIKSGSEWTIPFLPEWRYNKLKEIGIDFSSADFPDMVFAGLPDEKDPSKMIEGAVLFHGILCTNRVSKGALLAAFLEQIEWKPSLVIFFDDALKRVESVVDAMCKRSIPCEGFHYLGAHYMPDDLPKDVVALQLNYLAEHETWISEDEARALLAQEKQIAF